MGYSSRRRSKLFGKRVSPTIKEQDAAVVYETPRIDHSDLAIEGLTEDYTFYAWTSFMGNSKKRIDARMIFVKK
jgi:hypothetical protein